MKYVIDDKISRNPDLTWSTVKNININTPKDFIEFMKEYEDLCKKYNISLAHEDSQGGFLIDQYDSSNVEWVCEAMEMRHETEKYNF